MISHWSPKSPVNPGKVTMQIRRQSPWKVGKLPDLAAKLETLIVLAWIPNKILDAALQSPACVLLGGLLKLESKERRETLEFLFPAKQERPGPCGEASELSSAALSCCS